MVVWEQYYLDQLVCFVEPAEKAKLQKARIIGYVTIAGKNGKHDKQKR
jgi:hypothetical protein